jgi:hypothetical protein
MPVPVAVGDIVQVTPRYTLEGQQCENVFHFRCVAADTDLTLHLLKVIAQCFITHLVPVLGNSFQLESVHGKIVGPAIGEEDEWVPLTTDAVTGAVATDTLLTPTTLMSGACTAGRTEALRSPPIRLWGFILCGE